MNSRCLLGAAAIALLLGVLSSAAADDPSDSEGVATTRGVILIISDSLRADHLGTYGYARDTSPKLDALAESAVLFERAYAQASWTAPSIASIFTGLNPSVHRSGHPKSRFGYRSGLPEQVRTVAEILAEQGFRTRALANNPAISSRLGYGQGFESYTNNEQIPPDRPTEPTAKAAIALLESVKDENFFLVWHLIDPHWPYYPPPEHRVFVDPEYSGVFQHGAATRPVTDVVSARRAPSEADRRQLIALYDGDIRHMDAQVGELLAAVDALGLRSRVSVLFTSDHGESFGEYGHYGHALQMYNENLQIPLLIRDRRLIPQRVKNVVQAIDILPTILELAGVPAAEGVQGQSLLPLVADKDQGRAKEWKQRPAFSEGTQKVERKALNTQNFELIFGPAGLVLNDTYVPQGPDPKLVKHPSYKLYRHGEPSPAPEVASRHPRVAAQLEKVMNQRIRENEARQLLDESGLYSFHFGDDWRERAFAVVGDVTVEQGAMRLGAAAEVRWRLRLPRAAQSLTLWVVGHCGAGVPFFHVSSASDKWYSLAWVPELTTATLEVEFNLKEGHNPTQLDFRFQEPEAGQCVLEGFYVDVRFGEPAPEIDGESRRRLEALGYTVD